MKLFIWFVLVVVCGTIALIKYDAERVAANDVNETDLPPTNDRWLIATCVLIFGGALMFGEF